MDSHCLVHLLAGHVPDVDIPGAHDQDEAILVQCQGVHGVLGVLDGVHQALLGDGEEGDSAILEGDIYNEFRNTVGE